MSGRATLRLLVVIATLAGVLVPAWVSPARAISVPVTLARSASLTGGVARPGSLTFEFAPTHVAFSWTGGEGTGVQFRTVSADGVVSRWRRAHEAHDAERGDQHFSGVLAVDRPSSIEWRALIPEGTSMEEPTIDYLNTLDGPREVREIPATADAVPTTPDIVTRAEWGADESLKRTTGACVRQFFPVQQLFVHHTAGSNFDKHPKATMRAIYWYHVVRQGWCDVGYNFVIGPDGTVFEGRWARRYAPWETHDSEDSRNRAVAGAHVSGYNSGSVGVSVMGNYSQVVPSPAVRRSLAELLAWEADRHDLRPRGKHTYRNPETGVTRYLPYIAGHRDAGYTECPGNILYAALREVRRDTERVMGAGKTDSTIVLQPSSDRVNYGEPVTFSGALADATGTALSGRLVRTYLRRGASGWQKGPEVTTGPDGTFSFVLEPEVNLTVVAIYDGDATTWGSESDPARVRVAPALTIQAEGGTAGASGFTHYPPGTESVTFTGTVSPAHVNRPVIVRIEKLAADGAYALAGEGTATRDPAGNYVFTWTVDDDSGGTYRAYARVPKDESHARGVSPTITFVIG